MVKNYIVLRSKSVNKQLSNKKSRLLFYKYYHALDDLATKPLSALLSSKKVVKLFDGSYLYRVGLRDRVLFSEVDETRVIHNLGSSEEIIHSIRTEMKNL